MQRRAFGAAAACVVLLAVAGPAAAQGPHGVVHAAGGWKAVAAAHREGTVEQWTLDALRFEDGVLRGRVSVAGSRLFTEGNLEAQLAGSVVSGTIADDAGEVLVRFEGRVGRGGMRGRYRDRSGEQGEWQWQGRLQP